MLIFSWIWQTLSRRLRRGGAKSGHTASSNNLVTFYNQIIQMPSTCSIRLLYWNYAEQFTCNLIFKTSFSRLNPGPRGQATAIKSSVR